MVVSGYWANQGLCSLGRGDHCKVNGAPEDNCTLLSVWTILTGLNRLLNKQTKDEVGRKMVDMLWRVGEAGVGVCETSMTKIYWTHMDFFFWGEESFHLNDAYLRVGMYMWICIAGIIGDYESPKIDVWNWTQVIRKK